MFSYAITKVISEHYSIHNGAVNVYYDNESEFGASLDILIAPYESKDSESKDSEALNNFVALNFTYHNKSSHRHTVLFSIMKIDKDTLMIRSSNNEDKFVTLNVFKSLAHMTDIVKEIMNVSIFRAKSDQYQSRESLMAQSKKLLENFTTLAKGFLNLSTPEKNVTDILNKVINLLKLERDEFANIVALNSEEPNANTTRAPSPLRT